jgi:hypothetical protein
VRGADPAGIKAIKYRSRPTAVIGQRFYIYATRQSAAGKLFLARYRKPEIRNPNSCGEQSESNPNDQIRMTNWSTDLSMPGSGPEAWMLELAEMLILKDLPTGVIVGTAKIERCERVEIGDQKSEDRSQWSDEGDGASSPLLTSDL